MRISFRVSITLILLFIYKYSCSQNSQKCIIKYDTVIVVEPNNFKKLKDESINEKKQVSVFFCDGFSSDLVKVSLNGKSVFSSKNLTTDKITGLAGNFNIKRNKTKMPAKLSLEIIKCGLCTFDMDDKISYIYVNVSDKSSMEITLSNKKYTFE